MATSHRIWGRADHFQEHRRDRRSAGPEYAWAIVRIEEEVDSSISTDPDSPDPPCSAASNQANKGGWARVKPIYREMYPANLEIRRVGYRRNQAGITYASFALFRYIAKKSMYSDHLRKGHATDGGSAAPNSRSLQLATALYNSDQLSRLSRNSLDGCAEESQYLRRPTRLMAKCISEASCDTPAARSGDVNKMDRHFILCLAKGVHQSHSVRRKISTE